MPKRPGITSPVQLSTAVPPKVYLARDYLRTEVRNKVQTGAWEQVRPGAYVDAIQAEEPMRRRLVTLAHAAAVSAQSTLDHVFSHETAAVLHGLPVVGRERRTHLIQDTRPGALNAPDVRRHLYQLPRAETSIRHGLPVTNLARTVLDCMMSLGRRDGLIIADAALHVGVDLEECEQILSRLAGRRGVVAARWVLAMADGGSESPGESLARLEACWAGLPRPVTQVPVDTHRGTFWGDLGWRDERVILEYDGEAKYEANGSASEAVLAEKRRQDAMEAAGWKVFRAVSTDLRHPDPLFAQVRAALRRRRNRPATS